MIKDEHLIRISKIPPKVVRQVTILKHLQKKKYFKAKRKLVRRHTLG